MKRILCSMGFLAIGAISLSAGWRPGLQTSLHYTVSKICLVSAILLTASVLIPEWINKLITKIKN